MSRCRKLVTEVILPPGDHEAASRVADALERYAVLLRQGGPADSHGELWDADQAGEIRIRWRARWVKLRRRGSRP